MVNGTESKTLRQNSRETIAPEEEAVLAAAEEAEEMISAVTAGIDQAWAEA